MREWALKLTRKDREDSGGWMAGGAESSPGGGSERRPEAGLSGIYAGKGEEAVCLAPLLL